MADLRRIRAVNRRTGKADHRRFPFTLSPPGSRPLESDPFQRKPGLGGPVPLVRKRAGPVKAGGFKASGREGFKGRRSARTPEPDRFAIGEGAVGRPGPAHPVARARSRTDGGRAAGARGPAQVPCCTARVCLSRQGARAKPLPIEGERVRGRPTSTSAAFQQGC